MAAPARRGLRAETRFCKAVAERWPQLLVLPSCRQDDAEQHFDFILGPSLEGEARGLRVDVKALRKAQRKDDAPSLTHTWVELHGTKPRAPGSVFGSCDLVVFETAGEDVAGMAAWLWVPRTRLADWVRSVVDAATVRIRDNAEYCMASTTRTGFPLTLYQRKASELLLWVDIETQLRPLAIDVSAISFEHLCRGMAAVQARRRTKAAEQPQRVST